jgi:hypothetical protein
MYRSEFEAEIAQCCHVVYKVVEVTVQVYKHLLKEMDG